jgi:hypothetical protein
MFPFLFGVHLVENESTNEGARCVFSRKEAVSSDGVAIAGFQMIGPLRFGEASWRGGKKGSPGSLEP